MEKKYTAGPWRSEQGVIDYHDPGSSDGHGQKDGPIEISAGDESDENFIIIATGIHSHPNAHLIASAPELLAEVEKSCIRCSWQDDFMGSDITNCPQVKTCGKAKAIAKAHGIS